MAQEDQAAPEPFNPKPDTAEGVAALLAATADFVEDQQFIRAGDFESKFGAVPIIAKPGGGYEVVPLKLFDEYSPNPSSRIGTAALLDLASVIEHTNRFKDVDSLIFADNDRRNPKLTVVLDYHHAGAERAPRHGRHRSTFAFPLSDEWKAWTAADGEWFKMREFAAFIEDRIIDVLPASEIGLSDDQKRYVSALGGVDRIATPAKLMELSTGLQVFEESEVTSAVKLQSGEGKMVFASRHTDGQGGDLRVPSMFVLGIPVFVNGEAYQVLARLRYRKTGADVLFCAELWRTDRVFDHAFTEALDKVKSETSLPVLLGKPEA